MSIDIKELSEQDLKQKIDNIKAEREKTANALKNYEKELERRKQDVPLGVPSSNRVRTYYFAPEYRHTDFYPNEDEDDYLDKRFFEIMNYFSSKESAQKHAEMLLDWRKALVANSKGESIDIKVLLPLLPKGWVAMEENGDWFWHKEKPEVRGGSWVISSLYYYIPPCFRIKPAEDWHKSLMECGL